MTTKIPVDIFLNMKRYASTLSIQTPNIILICPVQNKKDTLKTSIKSWNHNIAHTYCEDKILISILNKLNESNYDKLLNDIQKENFSETRLIELIFNKAIKEPNYIQLYTKLCTDLQLCNSINEKCSEQFYSKRHLNLMKFMFSLYNDGSLPNITKYIDMLTKDINDINVEILIHCEKEYPDKTYLKSIFDNIQEESILKLSPRYKFMLTDVIKKYAIP
jgi:hypothetical protein